MRQIVNTFYSLLRRELNFVRRDKDILVIILLSPLFYAFFYGSIYMNKTEHSVPVVVIDNSHSQLSRQLVRSLDSHQLISVVGSVPDMSQAEDKIFTAEAQGIIYIPKDFHESLKAGRGSDLKVYANASRFLVSNDINKAVTEVVATMGAAIRLRYFQVNGYNYEQAVELVEPLRAEIKNMFNTVDAYGDFLIPGLLVLILQQTMLIGLAESVAKEREDNTFCQLFGYANGKSSIVLAGKTSYYFILFASYTMFFFIVHFNLYKIPLRGNILALALMTGVFLLSVLFLSFFIASFFKKKIISLQFFVFTSYPVFLLSGYSWPIQTMPVPLQVFTQFIHLLILALIGYSMTLWRLNVLRKKETPC